MVINKCWIFILLVLSFQEITVMHAAQPRRNRRKQVVEEVIKNGDEVVSAEVNEALPKKRSRRLSVAKRNEKKNENKSAGKERGVRRSRGGLYSSLTDEIHQAVDKTAALKNGAARMVTAVVPLGLAAAGTQQIMTGNVKTGGALIAGAGVATVLRAILIKKMLQKNAQTLEKNLKIFINEWPAKKEKTPEILHATLDRIYAQYNLRSGRLDGQEMLAFAGAVDAIALMARAKKPIVMTDAQRCNFLQRELCDLDKNQLRPSFFFAQLLAESRFILNPSLGRVGLGSLPLLYILSPALRQYAVGVKDFTNLTSGQDIYIKQRALDAPDLEKTWPGRVAAPFINKNFNSETQQVFKFFASLVISYMFSVGLKTLITLIKAGFIAHATYQAHLLTLDSFISVWPAIKSNVPAHFHERFNALYDGSFDVKANKLCITHKERASILRQVTKDLAELRKIMKKQKRPVAEKKEDGAHA